MLIESGTKQLILAIIKDMVKNGLIVKVNDNLNRVEFYNALNHEPIGYMTGDAGIVVIGGLYKSNLLVELKRKVARFS